MVWSELEGVELFLRVKFSMTHIIYIIYIIYVILKTYVTYHLSVVYKYIVLILIIYQ